VKKSSRVFDVHEAFVVDRRVRRLAALLSQAPPQNASVLDVGCGSGEVLAEIVRLRPDLAGEAKGIDVLIRPETMLPIEYFDGTTIPYPDKSFDVVTFVDVLHHTEDPLVLLKEARRVARTQVLVKDHVNEGSIDRLTLRFMDWVGNARHGVNLPYNYLSRAEWYRVISDAGLEVRDWRGRLDMYPPPARWVFDRGLHMVATLTPSH